MSVIVTGIGVALGACVGMGVALADSALGGLSSDDISAALSLGVTVGVAACKSLTRIAATVGVCAGTFTAVALAVGVAVCVGTDMDAALSSAAGVCPHAKTASRQSAIAASQVSSTKP